MYTEKVLVQDLDIGMYVSALDRPWLETPFLLEGFLIERDEDISYLRQHCEYVYVDVERSRASFTPSSKRPPSGKRAPSKIPHGRDVSSSVARPGVAYEDVVPVEREIEFAQEARASVDEAVRDLMDAVSEGKKPNLAQLADSVADMENSIIRNPDAFMLLRHLKGWDSYTYAHCIDCSVLAIAFGRHLGLPREQITDIGLASLLADVGKMRVPTKLLMAPGPLTEAELEQVRRHVGHSLDIMEELPGMRSAVLSAVSAHHERYDGTGYPNRLGNSEIPLSGRIVGLADWFDALTSDRPYSRASSVQTVVQQLYEARDTLFASELVERFIQMLGTYPVGSLVELSTGEVGVVIGQNRTRRLRPKVMLVLDSQKNPLQANPIRDLLHESTAEDGSELAVVTTLSPGAYGISPEDYFL